MKRIAILLAVLAIMACNGGGGESPSTLEMIRMDFAFGQADKSVSEDAYEIGPVDSPIVLTSEETDGSRMRLIGHVYNTVRITSQHISLHNTNTAEEITEVSESWDLAPCASRDSAWITQWYIYTYGQLAPGTYTMCIWVESNGRESNAECIDIMVVGDGNLLPQQLEIRYDGPKTIEE